MHCCSLPQGATWSRWKSSVSAASACAARCRCEAECASQRYCSIIRKGEREILGPGFLQYVSSLGNVKRKEKGKGKGIGERSWLAVDVSGLRVLGLVGVVTAEGVLHAPLSEKLNEEVSPASPVSLLLLFLLFMHFLFLFYSRLLFLFFFLMLFPDSLLPCFSLFPRFSCFPVFFCCSLHSFLFASPCFPVPLLLPGPLLPCFPCFPAFFVFLLAFPSYHRSQYLLGGLKGSVSKIYFRWPSLLLPWEIIVHSEVPPVRFQTIEFSISIDVSTS